jgi:NDP-sugar pyrophosphorylase family protein
VLNWLYEGGISEATVCGNSHTLVLRRYLESCSRPAMNLGYYEDRLPRGPAGCVKDAAAHSAAESFVVADGTIIPRVDLSDLLDAHRRTQATITVVAATEPNENGPDGRSMVPAGVYVFSRRAMEAIPATGYHDIKEGLIPCLYAKGERVLRYDGGEAIPRVTGADSVLALNEWMLEQIAGQRTPLAGYREVGEARIHAFARVDPTAQLVGPVLVGPETTIASGATIIGPTVVGAQCTVSEGVVISRSAIWDRCSIGAYAVVDCCILTHDTTVEADGVHRNVVHVPPRRGTITLFNCLICRWLRTIGIASPTCAGNHARTFNRGGSARCATSSQEMPHRPLSAVGVIRG